jgi:hypothetical protein
VLIYSQFEGSAIHDGQCISRRVVSTVTDLSKEINGVNTVVVWEGDYTEGEEVEAELAKARARSNWRSVPTRSRSTTVRHSQLSPHFEWREPTSGIPRGEVWNAQE